MRGRRCGRPRRGERWRRRYAEGAATALTAEVTRPGILPAICGARCLGGRPCRRAAGGRRGKKSAVSVADRPAADHAALLTARIALDQVPRSGRVVKSVVARDARYRRGRWRQRRRGWCAGRRSALCSAATGAADDLWDSCEPFVLRAVRRHALKVGAAYGCEGRPAATSNILEISCPSICRDNVCRRSVRCHALRQEIPALRLCFHRAGAQQLQRQQQAAAHSAAPRAGLLTLSSKPAVEGQLHARISPRATEHGGRVGCEDSRTTCIETVQCDRNLCVTPTSIPH